MIFRILIFLVLHMSLVCKGQNSQFNFIETEPYKEGLVQRKILDFNVLPDGTKILMTKVQDEFSMSTYAKDFSLDKEITINIEKNESYITSQVGIEEYNIITVIDDKKEEITFFVTHFKYATNEIKKERLFTVLNTTRNSNKNWTHSYIPFHKEEASGFLASKQFSSRGKHRKLFATSDNGKFMAFLVGTSQDANAFTLKVYDSHFNQIYEQWYSYEVDNYYELDDFIVTNNGSVYSCGKVFLEGKRAKRKREVNYNYLISKATQENINFIEVDTQEKFINQIQFSNSSDNTLNFLGFYSSKNSDKTEGPVSLSIDKNSLDHNFIFTPFPLSVFDDVLNARAASKKANKNAELRNFYIDHIFKDKKGNTYVLAEEFYTVTSGSRAGGVSQSYVYGNILITKIGTQSELQWARVLLKESIDSESYGGYLIDNEINIFLNTGNRIENKSNNRQVFGRSLFERKSLHNIIYNESGEQEIQHVRNNEGSGNDKYYVNSGLYTNDTLIMTNRYKGRRKFMVLTKK